MSYFEVYQREEPSSWRAYDSSNYDSYDRPYNSEPNRFASLVPVRVIERGHVDPDRTLQKKHIDTYWDRSDHSLNYVVYPGADEAYQSPTSSSYDYNYYARNRARNAADDYANYSSGSYESRRRTSSFKDHDSYGRSAAYDYSYSSSPEHSGHYYHDDNYPRSSKYFMHNDHHRYRSYDAQRYR